MKDETILVSSGRHPEDNYGIVNPPVYHASTVVFPTLAAWRKRDPLKTVTYGRAGTPTTHALQEAVAAIEGGAHALACSSGLGAITTALLAFVKAGDHILCTDSAYFPTRNYCQKVLARFGVETTYYDPLIGGDIAGLIRPNTRVIYTECPGSLTFDMQDIPAIAAAAHARGVIVMNDNTWATGLYFKSFEKGVDVSVHAGTKYIVGHSDAMLGMIVTTEAAFAPVWESFRLSGQCAGPDDMYLGLRGFRTMGARLVQHQQRALTLANWLKQQPEVTRVLYPALPDHPGHAIWKRDFGGASGLFSVVLDRAYDDTALGALLDGLELFGMGASWGGYESLVLPAEPSNLRTATKWDDPGTVLRFHVGLEHSDDQIADLAAGFERLRKAVRA